MHKQYGPLMTTTAAWYIQLYTCTAVTTMHVYTEHQILFNLTDRIHLCHAMYNGWYSETTHANWHIYAATQVQELRQ